MPPRSPLRGVSTHATTALPRPPCPLPPLARPRRQAEEGREGDSRRRHRESTSRPSSAWRRGRARGGRGQGGRGRAVVACVETPRRGERGGTPRSQFIARTPSVVGEASSLAHWPPGKRGRLPYDPDSGRSAPPLRFGEGAGGRGCPQ